MPRMQTPGARDDPGVEQLATHAGILARRAGKVTGRRRPRTPAAPTPLPRAGRRATRRGTRGRTRKSGARRLPRPRRGDLADREEGHEHRDDEEGDAEVGSAPHRALRARRTFSMLGALAKALSRLLRDEPEHERHGDDGNDPSGEHGAGRGGSSGPIGPVKSPVWASRSRGRRRCSHRGPGGPPGGRRRPRAAAVSATIGSSASGRGAVSGWSSSTQPSGVTQRSQARPVPESATIRSATDAEAAPRRPRPGAGWRRAGSPAHPRRGTWRPRDEREREEDHRAGRDVDLRGPARPPR